LATYCDQAALLPEIYAVDTWAGAPWESTNPDHNFKLFWDNVTLMAHGKRVMPIRKSSTEAVRFFAPRSVDFAFIDASHEYWDVRRDAADWATVLKPDGILAGHDADWGEVNLALKSVLRELPFEAELKRFNRCWYLKTKENNARF
jgi:hypothetical protein